MDINNEILYRLSKYLNDYATSISKEQIESITSIGVSENEAYKLLLASYLNIEDRKIIDIYFKNLKSLDEKEYIDNPYYKDIIVKNKKYKSWEIKKSKYKPYELFVYDDFVYENNFVIPCIGYFNKSFYYLAVYDNDRLWMSITPNEINTMKEPINNASGNVITFGLGLGYYAYMVSNKENVNSVTIIEKDENVINLFKNVILPKFKNKDKIKIINIDAYEYLEKMDESLYDYCFVDIYHDASDGLETYKRFKPYEEKYKSITFNYWIYKTIKYYL